VSAIPKHITGGHWYSVTGEPCHFVEKKDGSGLRSTTLADARKNNWLPSVTTIDKILDKPQLTAWKVDNALTACITTPRLPNETDDEFKARVLAVDVESISDAAKQIGTDVHDAIEKALAGQEYPESLKPYVAPVLAALNQFGKVAWTEKVLVGVGYAGRADCMMENEEWITMVDFKTTGSKKLPTKSYDEHRRQLSAYSKCIGNTGNKRIRTANIYISTVRQGEISVCVNEDWQQDFSVFAKIVELWQLLNNFKPQQ
jgi:hypothetical protein